MRTRKIASQDDIKAMKAMRKKGMSYKEIAEKTGFSQRSVFTHTNPSKRDKNAKIAIKMYREGMSILLIAREMKRSEHTIRKYLREVLEIKGDTSKKMTLPAIKPGTVKFELGGNKNTVVYARPDACIEELRRKYGV